MQLERGAIPQLLYRNSLRELVTESDRHKKPCRWLVSQEARMRRRSENWDQICCYSATETFREYVTEDGSDYESSEYDLEFIEEGEEEESEEEDWETDEEDDGFFGDLSDEFFDALEG